MKIGVLALQGDFAEHIQMLQQLAVPVSEVRMPAQLEGLQGLIIPGGESTVIGPLLQASGLMEAIRQRVLAKTLGVWGTCAGAVLLAERVANSEIQGLQLMDIHLERNAFGRQLDSFVTTITSACFEETTFPGVFIRAPLILHVGKAAQAVAWLPDGRIVGAQQGKLLATAFHPELTKDTRFHAHFLSMLA